MTSGAELTIDVSEKEGEVRLVVAGELDLSSVPRFEAALALAEDGNPPVLDLELSELTFIDSTGLRAILQASHRAESEGRSLVISNPSPTVRRLLAVTAMDHTIPIRQEDAAT
ncbi:MAG TPA: STAS domain-containing protein [Thermoleophilaceae bacterium]|jgi:anti-anti-sigma factor